MGRLDGRVALVTGASRGFGRAIALALGREGADVAVNYHTQATAAAEVVDTLAKLGRRALALRADVAREGEARALVEGVGERFGRIDVLVNNAGVMERGPFADTPISRYGSMFAVNVMGTLHCTRHALPGMIARKYGRIVNLSLALAGGRGNGRLRRLRRHQGRHRELHPGHRPRGGRPRHHRQRHRPRRDRHRHEQGRHDAGVPGTPYPRVCRSTGWGTSRTSPTARCSWPPRRRDTFTGQVLHPSGGWVMASSSLVRVLRATTRPRLDHVELLGLLGDGLGGVARVEDDEVGAAALGEAVAVEADGARRRSS